MKVKLTRLVAWVSMPDASLSFRFDEDEILYDIRTERLDIIKNCS